MAIEYYTAQKKGSELREVDKESINFEKDELLTTITDNNPNPFTSQYGYSTSPMDAESLDNLASLFKNNNPAVADGNIRIYDTSKGNTQLSGNGHAGSYDFNSMMNMIRKELYIPTGDYKEQLNTLATRYNRFKLPNVDMEIKKGYAHVFFCRPLCHLLDPKYGGSELLPSIKAEGAFNDIFLQNPALVNEISDMRATGCQQTSDFMYLLSNYVKSFSLNDEELHSDTYGKTYTGYKISYGKTNIESKTAGSFSVTFADDKTLSIYKIHRMWTDYINGVYRGKLDPDLYNIANKILDYCGSVYYILTAEDNETILFWSKYYGVYPTSIPSSQYSWNAGSVVNPESITIQYNYSWKEDFQTTAIAEFNGNAKMDSTGTGSTRGGNVNHAATFNKSIYYAGPTIVGTPYIERLVSSDSQLHYTNKFIYKLRFVPAELM